MVFELPKPKYPLEHGCSKCRGVCDWVPRGEEHRFELLQPMEVLYGTEDPGKPWTQCFRFCGRCEAIWAMSFNPKDGTYVQTPTPSGMKAALSPDASLADLMEPLFAWAPVDEMTERGLWEITYAPQELFDRLVAAWRHPEVDVARQSDILRQLARLVNGNNPRHVERRKKMGWLLEDFRGFEGELNTLEALMVDPEGVWSPTRYYSEQYLTSLQRSRVRPEVVKGAVVPLAKEEVKAGSTKSLGNFGEKGLLEPEVESPVNEREVLEALRAATSMSPFERTRQLLRHPWRFGPGVLFAWVLVERVGAQVGPENRPPVMGFFFLMALVFPAVVVARSAGATSLPWWLLVWRRLSVVADYAMVGLGMAVLVFAVAGLLTAIGISSVLSGEGVARLVIGAVAFVGLLRLWPFVIVPYMQAPEADQSDPSSSGFWKKSSVSVAWKLTRRAGTFRRFTLPWFLAVGAGILVVSGATSLGGVIGRSLVLYPIVLPCLTAFTWTLVERIEADE